MTLALKASAPYKPEFNYIPATECFCDGLEFKLGAIPSKFISVNLNVLLNVLNTNLTELLFKHALLKERGKNTFLWLVLYPENAQLTPRTM